MARRIDTDSTKASKKAKKSPPLWGFVDRQGKVVVPPTWVDVGRMVEGRAPVTDGKRWGYVDGSGRLVVPLRYRDASLFFHGHGVVVKDIEAGYGHCIDFEGRESDELRWVRSDGFIEIIERPAEHAELDEPLGTRRWLFPDGTPTPGEPLGLDRFARQGSFLDGPARLLDRDGQVLVKFGDHLWPFHEGRAVVRKGEDYTLMRPDGTVLRGRWKQVTPMSEGRSVVGLPGGGYGIIDPEGELVYPPAGNTPDPTSGKKGARKKKAQGLEYATPFRSGRSIVTVDGRHGLMDRDGAFVLSPSLETLTGPHEGLWVGTLEDGRGVLVTAEGQTLPLPGEDPRPISGGPWFGLRHADSGKRGVVDGEGREVLPFEYDALGETGPLLEVNLGADEDGAGGRAGFVDLRTGALVVPIIYLEVGAFRDEPLAPFLAPAGDESGDYPFRVYGAAPDDWASDGATWRIGLASAPTAAQRALVEARLGSVRWDGAYALATWDLDPRESPARPLRAIEALHPVVPLREAVLLEARAGSSGSAWEAWSLRQQARPDQGPTFGLASLYWRID